MKMLILVVCLFVSFSTVSTGNEPSEIYNINISTMVNSSNVFEK